MNEAPGRSSLFTHSRAASGSALNDVTGKPGGSGTGSSTDSLASEVGRLSEENARYRQKIADLMGKSTAGGSSPMPPSRASSSSHLTSQNERMGEQIRRLKKENQRLADQNMTLERRLSCNRASVSGDQLWRAKEDIRNLRRHNAELRQEKEKFDRTANIVCQKVLKIIGAARREGNFNSQLVGELKRWNQKLEDENHRLYNIIDRMQNKGKDVDEAVAEATVLSKNHDKDRDGNAAIVKELETQNVKIQEEMTKLSDQAMSLQNLSSSSSGSSGPLPPRTPSNHEMDGTAPRRSRTPDKESLKSLERQRSGPPRRQSRAMSMESVGSGTKEEFEFLKQNNKKYTEEIERIGADLAYVRERVSEKNFSENTRADLDKLSEASARVASLEHANSQQAVEIERLMANQLDTRSQSQKIDAMKEDYQELEDDCLRLATEVERLQEVARRVIECEGLVEEYRSKLAALEAGTSPSEEANRLKSDQIEMQRTLAAMAAEKAVLQAELRELLEERTQLQSDLEDLDNQVQLLQDRANSAAYLETELEVAKEENQAHCQEIENLRIEKEQLKAEIRSLSEETDKTLVRADSMAQERDERDAEIAALQAENKDLAAKAYNQVMLNVELTTLRNQVKDLQDLEISFQEQIQNLKSERAALQKEADTIPALKAEIAELHNRVQAAESQQKRRDSEISALRDSPRQSDLVREHEDRGRRIRDLLEQNNRMDAELGRAETRLRSLQAKYDSLLRDHTQRSQQAAREQEEAESQASVLNLALKQERTKCTNLGREAAELHSLLQTASNERQSIERQLSELRNENAKLVRRVTELDGRNEEHERTLATVLSSRENTNGHIGRDENIRVTQDIRNGPSPGRSPFEAAASPKSGKGKGQDANGKTDKNGFGSFFKKKSKNAEAPQAPPQPEPKRQRSPSPVPPPLPLPPMKAMDPPRSVLQSDQSPEQEVMDVYDRFVDSDDVDGFMTALGYKGFRSPTAYNDMKGAFASAKYVVRPEVLANLPEYQRQKAEATHDLIEAWHSAWVESLADQDTDLINNNQLMRSF